ncbi:MAG: hypothetical protein RLZZ126_63 [Pseudomonadota bacterium]|jgi:dihydroneopterin triphosphate diphosphatase
MSGRFKIPQSVLVVIHTSALDVLLLRRVDTWGMNAVVWQSVTGSKDHPDEAFEHTAVREVLEETGFDCAPSTLLSGHLQDWRLENVYDIYPGGLKRYAPGVTRNQEHLFSLCLPDRADPRLSAREHDAFVWLPWQQAAEQCFSASNAEAILMLPRFVSAGATA